MWFIGVEVEQETSAPPPKKNPGSAPVIPRTFLDKLEEVVVLVVHILQNWEILRHKFRSGKRNPVSVCALPIGF